MTERKLALQSEVRRAVLRVDETERPRLVLLAISGPSPYLTSTLGPIGTFLFGKNYFISVTDRSVFVHRGPRMQPGPRELAHVIPIKEAGGLVKRVKRGGSWSALFLQFPGDAKPTRLNVSLHSRAELDSFLARFPEGAQRS